MSLLNRSVLVAAVVLAGGAFAQPANDLCSGAQVLTAGASGVVVTSNVVSVAAAASASENTFSCRTSTNRSVWYTVTPSVTGTYRIENCPTSAPGVTITDTIMAVYTGAACTGLTEIAAGCNDTAFCGSRASLNVRLTAGTQYWVQAAVGGSTAPSTGATDMQVSLTLLTEPANPPDECSAANSPIIPVNRTWTVRTSADGGTSPALNQAQLPGDGGCFTGIGNANTNAPGRDVAYQFRAPSAGRYSFRVGAPSVSVNSVLYLADSCVPASSGPATYEASVCRAAVNRSSSGTTTQEQVSCFQMSANESVFVWIDEQVQSIQGAELSLTVSPCLSEIEPNDTPATANALSCAITGGIADAGESDFFALGLHPAGSRVFAVAEGGAASSTDFDLRLNTATGTLEYDDTGAPPLLGGSSGAIVGYPMPAQPMWLQVNHWSSSTIAEPYILYSFVKTGTPTPETEPNNTFATASASPNNYFTGSLPDGGEVDMYAFSGNEGDVVFAALDPAPLRADGGTSVDNYILSIVDSTGTVIFTDDDSATTIDKTTSTGLRGSTPSYPGDALVYRLRASGSYALQVSKTSGTNSTPYVVAINVGCTDTQPSITSITPNTGTPAGGEAITIVGTNLNDRSVVRFGTEFAMIESYTGTQLVVRSPASALGGVVDVSVVNGIGLSATSTGGFTYEDPAGVPPTLTSVTPGSGRSAGGTVVTLTGTVFRPDAGVFFDVAGNIVAATSVTRSSSTRLLATTPAHNEGAANVLVINTDNLSAQLDGGFVFLGPPTIATVTPNSGLTPGGQTITITGTNFRTGTTVTIGGTAATSVTPATDGLSLTAVTPSSSTNGVKDVVVTTSDSQTATLTGGYTYNYAPPTLASVSPASGFASGNTLITLTGANFLAAPTVTVGGVAATSVNRTSSTSVTARTPAGTPGPAPVVLTNSDGQITTATVNFTYVAAPTVASISPSNGSALGGTRITITGTDFTAGARVTIGGVPAFAVAVSSSTTLTATTNSGAPGTYDVVVTNPDTQSATLAGGFTLDAAPLLASLSPIGGSTAGGTVVTLTGSGFRTGAEVIFGSTPATAVTVVSDTELTATTAMHAIGVVSVTVRNQDGQSSELARSFRFVDPPSLTAIAPTSGDVAGGTTVRLTGAGFSQAATVTFGGTSASQVTLISASELDVVAPAHAAGAVDVVVTVDGATATLAGAFTYTRGAPSVAAAAPRTGPIEGGTLVTITGSGFADGATVTFGGTAATSVVVASADLIRAVAPAHAAGAVDIVVTNDDAQAAALSGGFTYTAASGGPDNSITDGGSGAVGTDPSPTPTPGGVSCGCTSFDGSMFGFAGLGLVALLSRRRRRS